MTMEENKDLQLYNDLLDIVKKLKGSPYMDLGHYDFIATQFYIIFNAHLTKQTESLRQQVKELREKAEKWDAYQQRMKELDNDLGFPNTDYDGYSDNKQNDSIEF